MFLKDLSKLHFFKLRIRCMLVKKLKVELKKIPLILPYRERWDLNSVYSLPKVFIIIGLCILSGLCKSQDAKDTSNLFILKSMSLEELMDIEIISVSKKTEKLSEVASAIQIITQDDIRRSGATNLPDALRLSSNLQVAQLNSYAWIISARGFNALFSNKLLVMIDGRTVYSPLFAGVFWDSQNVLLEDIDRIEVISGPGGSVWGANAVNGVINIITKKAKDSKGLYLSGLYGSFVKDIVSLRYGGNVGSGFSYRAYVQNNNRDSTRSTGIKPASDKWNLLQSGFRMDWSLSQANALSVQGNFYNGIEYNGTDPNKADSSVYDGQNVLGKWSYAFSDKSNIIVQVYFDRTWRRDIPSTISDELKIYDFDFQHQFPIGISHTIVWGTGYRFMEDAAQHSTQFVAFIPSHKNMYLLSGFVSDEVMLVKDMVKLALGTKVEQNNYSGFEFQPGIRLACTIEQQTLWAAVSRAIREPSRIDVDYHIPAYDIPVGTYGVDGGPNFISEKVMAYELGYRAHLIPGISISLAPFYNRYFDLYSVDSIPGTLTYQIQNGSEGYSWGVECSGNYEILDSWKIRGGYTYFNKVLDRKPGQKYDPSTLGNDAKHQFLMHSVCDLPLNLQFDVAARYLSRLPNPYTPEYFTVDARLAWIFKSIELSIIGQNLIKDKHQEFGALKIPRNIYGKITWRF